MLIRRTSPSTRIIGGMPAERWRSDALFLTENASSSAISMRAPRAPCRDGGFAIPACIRRGMPPRPLRPSIAPRPARQSRRSSQPGGPGSGRRALHCGAFDAWTRVMSEDADSPVVAFIGGGNMARSLVGGMVARGVHPDRIRVADRNAANREQLAADFGVQCFATPEEAVEGAAFWVLAVKPQGMRPVCNTLASLAQQLRPVALSVAAGITSRQIADWLGGAVPVVRAMPNTPSLL